jgi:hypothetical protein
LGVILKKGIPIVIISILVIIFISGCVVFDSIANFKGPEYIPPNFQLVKNTTTENSSVLIYRIPNKLTFFAVAAVKDSDKTAITNLTSTMNSNRLSSNSSNVIKNNGTINVDGHQAELYTETLNFFGVGISFYDITWHCDNSGLTIFSFGLVASSEMGEIKKMLESIKCHRFIFF